LVAIVAIAVGLAGTTASARTATDEPLAFYPQAGILGQDVFVNNFVDLDPGPGVRDWRCGARSYDGHTGIDSDIRSFREQRIGVPVFAALDGRVLSVQTGINDFSHGSLRGPFDNHIVLEHPDGRHTVYGHLADKSITLRRGALVRAGQQIALTASSGNSTGPHLHFTIRRDGVALEPFAGPCREGASLFRSQPELPEELYARDFAFSAKPFRARTELPWDAAVRTGTFVRGARTVHFRLIVGNSEEARAGRVRFVRPDGTTALDRASPSPYAGRSWGWTSESHRLGLGALGRWTLRYDVGGRTLVEAPFDVVANARRVRNRPPRPVAVELAPAAPRADEVAVCRIATSLVAEDPDYDIVRYRYRWTVGDRVVREVTSAALSDAIPRATARPGEAIGCSVVPSDGRLRGPAASATATAG
jgi:murein DD-endopeptidase MepM/ murein hydrolase activator NlpD